MNRHRRDVLVIIDDGVEQAEYHVLAWDDQIDGLHDALLARMVELGYRKEDVIVELEAVEPETDYVLTRDASSIRETAIEMIAYAGFMEQTGEPDLPGCTFCGGEGHLATAHDQSEVW